MKLKVLHINANTAGGAFIVAQRLHEALNLRDDVISNHLVFDGKPGNYTLWANTPFKKAIALSNHALDKLDFLRFEASAEIRFQFNHASRGIDISKHPLVRDADIIHFHWVHKGFLSFRGLEKLLSLNKKFIWTCHDLWPVTGGCYYTWGCDHLTNGCFDCKFLRNPANPDRSTEWFGIKERLWGKGQIRFITPSRWLAEIGNTSKLLLSPQIKPIKAIPNAINTNFFAPVKAEQKRILKQNLGLDPDLPVILFSAANLNNPAKGFEYFLQCMNNLVQLNARLQFLVLGRSYAQPIPENLPAKFVGFESNINSILTYYQTSDIYVTTAIEDNLPTTVMEALSCGLPCLGFRVGGIPELIDHEKNGFILNTGDVKALTDLLLNPEIDWMELGLAARQKAKDTYDTQVVLDQIVEEYWNL
jgi:glycosyltransferase involved in cell wall biosynthesis